jgi:pyruvate/2-oxoglutarate dehydrogenase complex dihydrolipoamide acyltransferase (E2) component
VVAEIRVDAGQTVKVGTCVAVIRGANEVAASPEAKAPVPASIPTTTPAHVSLPSNTPAPRAPQQKLSPVVRRLLAEHGIAASEIRGTGREGRVMRDDVVNHIKRRQPAAVAMPAAPMAPKPSSPPPAAPVPVAQMQSASTLAIGTDDIVVPLNNIRRRSAAAIAHAWQAVPHVLQAVEADYSRIEAARRAAGEAWRKREGYSLTYLPFLAWAVTQALLRHGQLNARIDGDNLIVAKRVHLGIAVDLDHDGLVVPVIRDAQDRSVPGMAREIRRLSTGARTNKLTPNDFGTPTYTISNSGVFGTMITAPIVNPPQVAILSTDGVSKKPVVVESETGDSIAIRPIGVLAQSFDHRAIDGAYSAAFLKTLKRIVEERNWVEDVVSS